MPDATLVLGKVYGKLLDEDIDEGEARQALLRVCAFSYQLRRITGDTALVAAGSRIKPDETQVRLLVWLPSDDTISPDQERMVAAAFENEIHPRADDPIAVRLEFVTQNGDMSSSFEEAAGAIFAREHFALHGIYPAPTQSWNL